MIISFFCLVPLSPGAIYELNIPGNWSLYQAAVLIASMAPSGLFSSV